MRLISRQYLPYVFLFHVLNILEYHVSAHVFITSVTSPSGSAPNKNCVRKRNIEDIYDTYPAAGGKAFTTIPNYQTTNLTCGAGPTQAAPEPCPIDAGSTLHMDFRIGSNHPGPCNVYLVPVDDYGVAPVAGWIKVFEENWDRSKQMWCFEKVQKDATFDVKIPKDVPPGKYIIRTELVGLHRASELNWTEFYVGCADLLIGGTGKGKPSTKGVSIPSLDYIPSPDVLVYNIFENVSEQRLKYRGKFGPKVDTFNQGGHDGPHKLIDEGVEDGEIGPEPTLTTVTAGISSIRTIASTTMETTPITTTAAVIGSGVPRLRCKRRRQKRSI